MRLCMFSPADRELERGWPGRIDGDTVIQLAAQTLQAFFTGGGSAREHARYPLAEIVFRAPVLHPPSVRIFDERGDFVFANAAAIHGPGDAVALPQGVEEIEPVVRYAAIVGTGCEIGGFTLMNDWHAPALGGQKARDFAISLGPIVTTRAPDASVDWRALVEHAVRNTRLLPGDVIACPPVRRLAPVRAGGVAEIELDPFGTLRNPVA